MNKPAVPPPITDENQIIAERRGKLRALRERGQAFPNDFRRDALAGDLHAAYDAELNETLEPKQVAVTVAGRMMLKRVMGKASFATLQDGTGRIQAYITQDVPGYDEFKHWDLGDVVGARRAYVRGRRRRGASRDDASSRRAARALALGDGREGIPLCGPRCPASPCDTRLPRNRGRDR
jgi:lysyl-tRNA synthetase class II